MFRRPPALLCYFLAFLQIFWIVGCEDSIRGGGSQHSSTLAGILANKDLGTVVFDLYRDGVEAEPASPARDARLGELDSRRQEFIDSVNDIVNVNTLGNVSQTIEAVFVLVDDDTLPILAEHAAKTFEELAQDPQALQAMVDLMQSRSGQEAIPVEQLIELLGRMFNYSETEQLWQATAKLISENDGVDDAGFPNGEPRLVDDLLSLLHDALNQAGQAGPPSTAVSQAMDEAFQALTEEATIRGSFNFGAPEWVVHLDDRGLPEPGRDVLGQLHPPFVDNDGDGLADVDANDRYVDAQGQVIDAPTFGAANTTGFDGAGRALAGNGDLLYVYIDAKSTILALFMQVGGELLDRDLLSKGRDVIEAGLGPQNPQGTYEVTNPVLELQWGMLELLKPEVAPRMLRASAQQINTDPVVAEQIMVALSRGINATHQASSSSTFSTTRISDPRMVDLVNDVLPLADDIFETQGSGSTSTARQVMDTLATLRTTAPNFGHQMAPLTEYVTVQRESTPDADLNDIDEARSWPVDRNQPAWIGNTDNRSALHQLLDLLARADGCTFFGNNLAVMILNLMADQSPATVSNLVSLLNALPGFLPNLFCSGVSQDLASLDSLARSGALDALLPLAKTFKDRGETELLVRLLVRIQQDYETVFRPIEPDLAAFLGSGALESFMEVIDLSRNVVDPVSGQSVADISAEAISLLVDDDATLIGPRGQLRRSRAHLLLDPIWEIDRRVVAAGATQEMDDLIEGLFEVFLETVNISGTEQLRNGSLVPLFARIMDIFSDALPADAATRLQDVNQAQIDILDFGTSRDFATVVDVIGVIYDSPSKALINRGLANLLTPHQNQASDIFGGLARLSVILLQTPPSASALQDLAPFLARVIDPTSPLVPDSLRAFERLLTADQGRTVLNVLRAAFNPAPGDQYPPATKLVHVFQAVNDAAGQSGAPYDAAALRADLLATRDFIRDDQDGLGWVFQLIRDREVN